MIKRKDYNNFSPHHDAAKLTIHHSEIFGSITKAIFGVFGSFSEAEKALLVSYNCL